MISQVSALEFLLAYSKHGEPSFWPNPQGQVRNPLGKPLLDKAVVHTAGGEMTSVTVIACYRLGGQTIVLCAVSYPRQEGRSLTWVSGGQHMLTYPVTPFQGKVPSHPLQALWQVTFCASPWLPRRALPVNVTSWPNSSMVLTALLLSCPKSPLAGSNMAKLSPEYQRKCWAFGSLFLLLFPRGKDESISSQAGLGRSLCLPSHEDWVGEEMSQRKGRERSRLGVEAWWLPSFHRNLTAIMARQGTRESPLQIWSQGFLLGACWSQVMCPRKLIRTMSEKDMWHYLGRRVVCMGKQVKMSRRGCHKNAYSWDVVEGKNSVGRGGLSPTHTSRAEVLLGWGEDSIC